MSTINATRLLECATMLENLPERRKQMRVPSGFYRSTVPVEFNLSSWTCGTSACAVGFCMFDPWFQDQGLGMNDGGGPEYDGIGFTWSAVEQFFGIDAEEAEHLFMDDSYEDGGATAPLEVAERIREFVADNS